MPIYEYKCKKCGHRFEKLHQSFSEARVKKCPECGGAVEQLFSAPAAHFKGEGFYVTDYARKGSGKPDSAAPSSVSPRKCGFCSIIRTQVFQRRMASSFCGGRSDSAFSYQLIASSSQE